MLVSGRLVNWMSVLPGLCGAFEGAQNGAIGHHYAVYRHRDESTLPGWMCRDRAVIARPQLARWQDYA